MDGMSATCAIGTRQAAVIGGLMVLFGALLLIQEFVEISAWIWAAVLVASGLGVYAIYSIARDEVWMAIVSYVLLAIGIMMALVTADILEDAYIAMYLDADLGNSNDDTSSSVPI